MKYQIKEIKNKNTTWDLFIIKYEPQSYFQSWDWGEVEKRSGKKVWRIAIFRIQNPKSKIQKWLGISQIIKIISKRGTQLHVRNGPVFKKWEKESFQFWLDYVKELACKENASFIRISPLVGKSYSFFLSEFSFRKASIHKMDGEIVSLLDVQKPEDKLLQNIRKNTRYLIRKGIKEDVIVKESNDIDLFLKLHKKTFQRHDFIPHQAITLEYEQFKKSNKAELLIAYHQNKPIAAAIVCYFGNQAIYRHGGSIQSKVPASYVLQWEIIKRVKKRSIPFYNLYGIADTDNRKHPWWGLTIFKKGFAGETIEYMHAHDLPLSFKYWINYMVETIRRKRKRL